MSLRFLLLFFISAVLVTCRSGTSADINRIDLSHQAEALIQQFAGTLKPQLQKALKTGDPAHAIEVCAHKAPALAEKLSAQSGWFIRRVSLKPRNQRTAVPDAWETSVLKDFNRRNAAGTDAKKLIASRIQDGTFRYMKAQIVKPLCLLCHGKRISPKIAQALKKYYPQDKATGYDLGEVRGAFSLRRSLTKKDTRQRGGSGA